MPKEELKFRPNEPEDTRAWQEDVAQKFGLEHDAEFFYVRITGKDGREATYQVPKHSGSSARMMEIKDIGPVPREEAIQAIQKIYPEMERPNLKEAILELRKRRERK